MPAGWNPDGQVHSLELLGWVPHRDSEEEAYWNFPGSRGTAPVQGLRRFTLVEMDRLVLPVPGESPLHQATEAGTGRRPPRRVAGPPSASAGEGPTSNHAPHTREDPSGRGRTQLGDSGSRCVATSLSRVPRPPHAFHRPRPSPCLALRFSPGSLGTSAYRTPLLLAALPSARSAPSGLALRTPRPLTRSATDRHALWPASPSAPRPQQPRPPHAPPPGAVTGSVRARLRGSP